MVLLNFTRKCLLTAIYLTVTIWTTCDQVTCLDTEEQIKSFGYPFEMYQVWTPDNYLLGLERIPHNGKHGANGTIGKPVMLIHGLFVTSGIFAVNNSSLSFTLSDAGFDVWLFNGRRVGLSKKLSTYNEPESLARMNKKLWDFSFHEMGVYDMTSTIDFILKKTGHSKLDVLGYSLGTCISLICLSERPEYNLKINKLILMAPTSRMKFIGMPLSLIRQMSNLFNGILSTNNFVENTEDFISNITQQMCSNKNILMFCKGAIDVLQGVSSPMNSDTISKIVTMFPQSMSSKSLKHMLQLIVHGNFSKFDYGPTENLLRYRSTKPPNYDLPKITAPTFVIHSKDDTFDSVKDVKWLISQLPNIKDIYYIEKKSWGHFSFTLSPMIKEVVNSYIENILLN